MSACRCMSPEGHEESTQKCLAISNSYNQWPTNSEQRLIECSLFRGRGSAIQDRSNPEKFSNILYEMWFVECVAYNVTIIMAEYEIG